MATAGIALLGLPASSRAAARAHESSGQPAVAVFPIPGARVAAPSTQITFRGVPASQLGTINVTGSRSGPHPGVVRADSDGGGGSFIPDKPFTPGETVTVRTSLNILATASPGIFHFTVAVPAGPIQPRASKPVKRVHGDVWLHSSLPGLEPAAIRVTRSSSRTAPGDLFVSSQHGPVQNGPELLDSRGDMIWFHAVPKGDSCTDVRAQTYENRPVVTWWQGFVGPGLGVGQDEIYSDSYQPVATVRAGNGLSADLHEFLIERNTAVITAYYPVYWNTSSVKGGHRSQIVLDSVVQGIDIPTGLVTFQWDSLDHVPLSDSYGHPPASAGTPWDYFHVNSVQQVGDGNLIISSRHTWSIYKVSRQTGRVLWTLGGKHSNFRLGPGARFAWQHDVRLRPGHQVTIFDNGAGLAKTERQSRGLTLRLGFSHGDPVSATLVGQDVHSPPLLAYYEGNVQRLANGDEFIGWGQQPELSEFNARGQDLFDARFVGNTDSYRAYRFPWQGQPVTRPSAVTLVKGGRRIVWVSWNGTTLTTRWRILGGPTPTHLDETVTTAAKRTFETGVRLPHAYHYVEAQALNGRGQVIGTSPATRG